MQSIKKIMVFLLVLLSTQSVHALKYPVCIKHHHHRQLLLAFMYPDNTVLYFKNLDRYRESFEHLDIIVYSLGEVDVDHRLHLSDVTQHNLLELHHWLVKQHLKTQIMLAIGGWESPDRAGPIYTDLTERKKFINSVIQVLKNQHYQLKGIDIDWENEFDNSQALGGKQFPSLIHDLHRALRKNKLTTMCLSVDMPISSYYAEHFPKISQWISSVSWLNIMAYDYYGVKPPYSELDGALGSVLTRYQNGKPRYRTTSLVNSLGDYVETLNVPKHKLVIALPFYASQNFLNTGGVKHHAGLRQPVIDPGAWETLPYWRIVEDYGTYEKPKQKNVIHRYTFKLPLNIYNTHAFWISAYDEKEKTYRFITYEDPIAIREITHYVRRGNFLGISAWYLLADLPYQDSSSLLRSIDQTLKE